MEEKRKSFLIFDTTMSSRSTLSVKALRARGLNDRSIILVLRQIRWLRGMKNPPTILYAPGKAIYRPLEATIEEHITRSMSFSYC